MNSPRSGQPRSDSEGVGRLWSDGAVDGEAASLLVGRDDGRHLGVHPVGRFDPPTSHVDQGEADRLQLCARLGQLGGFGRLLRGTEPDVVPPVAQRGRRHAAAYQLGIGTDGRDDRDGLLEGGQLPLGGDREPSGRRGECLAVDDVGTAGTRAEELRPATRR